MSKKRRLRKGRAVLVAVTALALLGGVIYGAAKTIQHFTGSKTEQPAVTASGNEQGIENQDGETKPQKTGTSSFTFTGVGDNLLHDPIFIYFEQDHGNRNYLPIYQNTLDEIRAADLAYINFETVCAGDAFGLSGYPDFNGPLEMIDTLAEAGFDWFSVSSNHSMDAGADGLITEIEYVKNNHSEIATTGAFVSEDDAAKPIVKDVNGIKVGLCGFTYDLNGYSKPEGYEWLVDVYRKDDGTVDYDLMKKKLDALKEVSDVQIVAMHWGDEYVTEVTPEQKKIAKFFNQEGVEAVIGSHPHVIEPVEFIKTPEQTTLVYYSLGNFVSAQDSNYTMVGGMASFTLNYDFGTQKADFSDVKFIPTVTWISPDLREYRTNILPEYTDEMAENSYITQVQGEDVSREWVKQYVQGIVGNPEGIEVVYE